MMHAERTWHDRFRAELFMFPARCVVAAFYGKHESVVHTHAKVSRI
jgi:hypothetical protein